MPSDAAQGQGSVPQVRDRVSHEGIVPPGVRIRFGHAAVQVVADQVGADVLHIKGPAADPDLRGSGGGSDADVLVRPEHVERLLAAMESAGWRRRGRFETGSPFGHALAEWHPHFGYADVHRFFPGMGAPHESFEVLWSTRQTRGLAGIECCVPDRTGQVLVHVLNGVRGHHMRLTDDLLDALVPSRAVFAELVERTGSAIAVDAALGQLERHRGRREYALWKVTSEGGTRVQEWAARIRAAPTLRAKARLVVLAPLVNTDHLATMLGHEPSRAEVAREFVARPARGVAQEWRARVTPRLRGTHRR